MLEGNNTLQHVAIIMDGNGRWAQKRGLPRSLGHKSGVKTVKRIIESCKDLHVPCLTLFAFSSENWSRPRDEVSLLMDLFNKTISRELQALHENHVCLRFIGDLSGFNEHLQETMLSAQDITQSNSGLKLNIAVNYGGRWDVLNAAKKMAEQYKAGELDSLDNLDELAFENYLSTDGLPPVDLLIRTGGEDRVSNFLLWQMAYSEILFSNVLWPDFSEKNLSDAIDWFETKQRRFGKTSEQVEKNHA